MLGFSEKHTILKIALVIVLQVILPWAKPLYSHTHFNSQDIQKALYEQISSMVGSEAEIAISNVIPSLTFRENGVTYNFDFGNKTLLTGNSIVGVEFRHNGNLLRRIEVPVRVKIYKNVLVAKNTIRKGEEISFENSIIERRELPPNVELSEIEPKLLFNKVARYNIISGSIITTKLLTEPFAIRRGEKVKVVVLNGKISVTTYGTALDDAGCGEKVRIRLDATKATVTGLAAKDGCVIITN